MFGERVLDLSPVGMLVSCNRTTQIGDDVLVSFKAPGADAPWFDAEAEVARVIQGYRVADPGYCAGLRFTYFEKSARNELLSRLAGLPPPLPQRRLRTARERASNGFKSARKGLRPSVTASVWFDKPDRARTWSPGDSVVVRQILMLHDEPIIPLTRRRASL
ncbi:MAG TPA: PilZ domain-containing protein [Polyangiales bacterium]|nr:PilZ domain-containing protein [Polyangiales bacterium]